MDNIKELVNLKSDRASVKKIHQDMNKNLDYNAPEAIILICAIFIASIGLNLGSTAVVIGAMLISPIMGPIQTLGYSLAIGDKELLKSSISRLLSMILVVFFVSSLYFLISPLNVASDEIIARTNPTFWDLLIAVFGGFAGIIGVTRSEKTNVVPGVAIATALMPPLCTVGFGLAHLDISVILGAFYLFIINAFFIMLASIVGFLLMGLGSAENLPIEIVKKSRRKIQIAFIIFTIPLLIAGYKMIEAEVVNANVTNYVKSEIETDKRKVVNTEIDFDTNTITFIVVGSTISSNVLDTLETNLVNYNLEGYKVQFIQSSISNTIMDTINVTEEEAEAIKEQQKAKQEEKQAQEEVTDDTSLEETN